MNSLAERQKDKKQKEQNVCGIIKQEVGPVYISDQLSSNGENSRSAELAIGRRGCFVSSG